MGEKKPAHQEIQAGGKSAGLDKRGEEKRKREENATSIGPTIRTWKEKIKGVGQDWGSLGKDKHSGAGCGERMGKGRIMGGGFLGGFLVG